MIRPPPRSPLFPYPTLFRSACRHIRSDLLGCLVHVQCFFGSQSAFGCLTRMAPSARHTLLLPSVVSQMLRAVVVRRRRRTIARSEEHTSELQSQSNLVCRLL